MPTPQLICIIKHVVADGPGGGNAATASAVRFWGIVKGWEGLCVVFGAACLPVGKCELAAIPVGWCDWFPMIRALLFIALLLSRLWPSALYPKLLELVLAMRIAAFVSIAAWLCCIVLIEVSAGRWLELVLEILQLEILVPLLVLEVVFMFVLCFPGWETDDRLRRLGWRNCPTIFRYTSPSQSTWRRFFWNQKLPPMSRTFHTKSGKIMYCFSISSLGSLIKERLSSVTNGNIVDAVLWYDTSRTVRKVSSEGKWGALCVREITQTNGIGTVNEVVMRDEWWDKREVAKEGCSAGK